MVAFIVLVALQLYISISYQGTTFEFIIKGFAAAVAVGLSLYSGFVLSYVRAISLWNCSLLPVLFSLSGILGGFGLLAAIAIYDKSISIIELSKGTGLMLVIMGILVAIYFMSVSYTGASGKESIKRVTEGQVAHVLWIGLVFVGIIIPLGSVMVNYFVQGIPTPLLVAVILCCELVQGFSFVYVVLKGGLYQPLVPTD